MTSTTHSSTIRNSPSMNVHTLHRRNNKGSTYQVGKSRFSKTSEPPIHHLSSYNTLPPILIHNPPIPERQRNQNPRDPVRQPRLMRPPPPPLQVQVSQPGSRGRVRKTPLSRLDPTTKMRNRVRNGNAIQRSWRTGKRDALLI
jgi:hypothetical protein